MEIGKGRCLVRRIFVGVRTLLVKVARVPSGVDRYRTRGREGGQFENFPLLAGYLRQIYARLSFSPIHLCLLDIR